MTGRKDGVLKYDITVVNIVLKFLVLYARVKMVLKYD